MTSRHTITHADEVYVGNAAYARYTPDGRRGVKLTHLSFVDLGTPDTASANGVLDGVTVETDEALAYTAGDMDLATLDVPRNLVLDTTDGQGSVDSVVTITGTDTYGATMVEAITMTDTTAVAGKKAFKTLTSISFAAGTEAATADVGWGDVLGLPFYIDTKAKIISPAGDGSVEDFTIVVGDTDQDSTAGDCRGTVDPTAACNDVIRFSCLIAQSDVSSKNAVFGYDQYSG